MTRAIILAGGYGTRMGPLTKSRPKHLLPLGDSPVIGHQLRMLSAAGITDLVLATAYHAEAFRPVLGDGADFGVRLRYSREDSPLGTGGALRHALVSAGWVDDAAAEPVVVLNGDLLTEHDLRRQLDLHDRTRAEATLHVRYVDDARPYGLVELDDAKITQFCEKPVDLRPGYINAGTYVVSPGIAARVPSNVPTSLEREIFPTVAAEGMMRGYLEEAYFADIGTPQALLAANLRWAAGRGCHSVQLSNAVAETADIRDSLVMPGAVVSEGALLRRTIVAPGAVIESDAHLADCVIADNARVRVGQRLTGVTLDVGEIAATDTQVDL